MINQRQPRRTIVRRTHRTIALRWQWWRPSSFALDDIAYECETMLEDIADCIDTYCGFMVVWYLVLSAPIWIISPTSMSQWSFVRWLLFAFYTMPVTIPLGAFAGIVLCRVLSGIKWVVQHPPIKIVTRYEEREQ